MSEEPALQSAQSVWNALQRRRDERLASIRKKARVAIRGLTPRTRHCVTDVSMDPVDEVEQVISELKALGWSAYMDDHYQERLVIQFPEGIDEAPEPEAEPEPQPEEALAEVSALSRMFDG